MILSDRELHLEIADGNIRFEPEIERDQVGDASVDLRLGRVLRIPELDEHHIIRPTGRMPPELYGRELTIPSGGHNLEPNRLVLGSTHEKLPCRTTWLVGWRERVRSHVSA